MNDYTIKQLRLAHLDACAALWQQDIRDTHGEPAIERMFRRVGWGGFILDGGYRNVGRYAWCGHFQSVTWMDIGNHLSDEQCVPVMLDPQICEHVLASTYRLLDRRKWQAAGVPMAQIYHEPSGNWSDQQIDEAFLPGCTATVVTREYGDYRDARGGHYVTIESVDAEAGLVATIEGNAVGILPDGGRGEGVVRQTRPIGDFRAVVHFDNAHYDYLEAG